MKRIALVMALTALVAVSACGKRGELERPPPLWGNGQQPAISQQQK